MTSSSIQIHALPRASPAPIAVQMLRYHRTYVRNTCTDLIICVQYTVHTVMSSSLQHTFLFALCTQPVAYCRFLLWCSLSSLMYFLSFFIFFSSLLSCLCVLCAQYQAYLKYGKNVTGVDASILNIFFHSKPEVLIFVEELIQVLLAEKIYPFFPGSRFSLLKSRTAVCPRET